MKITKRQLKKRKGMNHATSHTLRNSIGLQKKHILGTPGYIFKHGTYVNEKNFEGLGIY